jgi:nucleoside phosphorylase
MHLPMHRAVIITSSPTDFKAILAHLKDIRESRHPSGTIYEVGQFPVDKSIWEVAVVDTASGNVSAAIETERAITHWQPIVVISIGTAIGLKDVSEGDIVAATQVYGYESAKITASDSFSRPRIGMASYRLEQRAKAEARQASWTRRVQGEEINMAPKVLIGVIAAGEKEIESDESELYQLLQTHYNDALAIDMAGYGILKAVHTGNNIEAIIIRGIIRTANQGSIVELPNIRIDVSRYASAFAFEILAKLDPESLNNFSLAEYPILKQTLADTSKALLGWQRALNNNQWIDRPELSDLLIRIETEGSTTTIVLGSPGVGKSALMATLGHALIEQGYVVFAIKADLLCGEIKNINDLQNVLKLKVHPSDAVSTIAKKEPIVVLIDQLDAISELLDRKSQRLNLLLSLIQRLSGRENVHIVATCREFEFQYGSQFARLSEIEKITLTLPEWEKISSIIAQEKHKPEDMSDPLRTLLRNPLNLNIFLEVASPGETFTSSQMLLDRLWQKWVLEHSNSEERIRLLENLANRMTDQEVLWLSHTVVDFEKATFDLLESAGILITNPESGRIGFRHQTFYDHTLARAFARDSRSLSELAIERQDGLFVRPILLRVLNYIRGTSPAQYDLEIRALLSNAEANNCVFRNVIAQSANRLLSSMPLSFQPRGFKLFLALKLIYVRHHIYSLLIEFVGSQQKPRLAEVDLLASLLKIETEGSKILAAVTGSSGWIKGLSNRSEFLQWLKKPAEQAVYCAPFLQQAASHEPTVVWDLLGKYWLNDSSYDVLNIRVVLAIGQWTLANSQSIQKVIRRSDIDWNNVLTVAEAVAKTLPVSSAKLIRAHFDRLLENAIAEGNRPKPELSGTANDVDQYLYRSKYDPRKPIANLLKSSSSIDLYGLKEFAESHPEGLLIELWPWFTDIAGRILRNELNEIRRVNSYKDDELSLETEPDGVIAALLGAIMQFATEQTENFVEFAQRHQDSDLLAVHRLLARGLQVVAEQKTEIVLDYLTTDPRRLCIGDMYDHHRETKRLISAIFPLLSSENRSFLEEAIINFDFYLTSSDEPAKFRLTDVKYNRQHRLRLFKAIPDEYLSTRIQRLKFEEERAFPNLLDCDEQYPTIANIVGSPMTKSEMSRASDEDLINLFDELAEFNGMDSLFRKSSTNLARAGSSVELSREFGALIKENPNRFFQVLPKLNPQNHGKYVGEALQSLSKTDFPASKLIELVNDLSRNGFSSESFCSDAADALGAVAESNQGLPSNILSLLESWLPGQKDPSMDYYRAAQSQRSDCTRSIFFDLRGSHLLPGGRGYIVRAIANGYLRQLSPDLKGWEKFIKSQLTIEAHPAIWVDIVSQMAPLLNGDRVEATIAIRPDI